MTKRPVIVSRQSVDRPAEYIGRMVPPVPHPTCHCGHCGQFPHERYHQVVQETRTADGSKGAVVLALIVSLN